MTSRSHDTTSKSSPDPDDSDHKSRGKYPARPAHAKPGAVPSGKGKTTPVPSGVRPDLAKPGPDGQGGDAGGVDKSL